MFSNDQPETKKGGEIRWFSFVGSDYRVTLEKVRCTRRWFDNVNGYYVTRCEVIEVHKVDHLYGKEKETFRPEMNKDGKMYTTVDYVWELQKTKEDAMRLLILQIFNHHSSYEKIPVWKL